MRPQEIDALRYWLAEEAPTGAGCPVGAAEMFGRALDELAAAEQRIADWERAAEKLRHLGFDKWGCDQVEHLADEVLALRARVAELEAVLERLVAVEGGAWHVERYARERQKLLGEASAVLAKARDGR